MLRFWSILLKSSETEDIFFSSLVKFQPRLGYRD
jgi:hypothetical protein